MDIKKTLWGHHEQQEIFLFALSNGFMDVRITNLGCTIVAILLPDANGKKVNMVLSYDSLQGYLTDTFYIGCVVGRFANRIANARFRINDVEYKLAANDGETGNHLHGGISGFNKKVFAVNNMSSPYNAVQFYYRSMDGEEGYPGNLDVWVTYSLRKNNELVIDYKATTDKTTPVNLTNHSYFNLSGSCTPAINHELFINANEIVAADAIYIPSGELKTVAGTDLDFRNWRCIFNETNHEPFRGYNECFSIAHATNETIAALRDPVSQRSMTVKTSLPGLMLYTGDFLKTPYIPNEGICLETQFFPDSPNQPHFPATLLQPGDTYQHQTVYQFFNSLIA